MTINIARLLLTVVIIVTATASSADPGDELWADEFYLKGLNNSASAVVVDSHGDIYVGGGFETADQLIVRYAAVWSGGSWDYLREGLNGTVYALAISPGGHLVAGGNFENAGNDRHADHIAIWNGSGWSSLGGLGSDLNALVRDLAFDATGNLYAVGNFLDAGGDPDADRVAVWNGSSWSSMGGPGSGLEGVAYTVAVSTGGVVVVGGSFTDAGGNAAADYIAGWNGSGWSAIGGGLNDTVYDLVFDDNNDLYVGGRFTDAGGVAEADRIAVWRSPSWWSVGGPGSGIDNQTVYCILIDDNDDLFIGGNFVNAGGDDDADYMARWTGTAWTAPGAGHSGLNNRVSSLALTGDGDIVAVGNFTHAGNYSHTNYAAVWDGNRWMAMTNLAVPTRGGLDGDVYALDIGPDGKLYAGGGFNDAGGDDNADRLAVWDGSSWDQVGDPMPAFDSDVLAVAVSDAGHVAVGGEFTDAAGIADADYFAYWDGAAWSALGGPGNPFESTVRAMTWGDDGRLYVGGDFWEAAGVTGANYVAIWDGASWSAADGPGGGPDSYVFELAVDGSGVLYAGGEFIEAGGDPDAEYIAKWDGAAWTSIGGPGSALPSYVHAIAIDELGRIYAGGVFNDAGGDPNGDHVAMWDGSSWTALGEGLNGDVMDLAFDGAGNLYAAGFFYPVTTAPNMPLRIAFWDGSSWNHLGSGLDNDSYALAYDGGFSVCTGGLFDIAGNEASANIGCWSGATPADLLFADGFETRNTTKWSSSSLK
ncbi:MAG: hypothetical protein V2I67_08815 [Thermoanaerobaculales bacterium]|jgi:hypothetical protein|nr:hypothetical protein [Thermoanaerobaculales bacterium]